MHYKDKLLRNIGANHDSCLIISNTKNYVCQCNSNSNMKRKVAWYFWSLVFLVDNPRIWGLDSFHVLFFVQFFYDTNIMLHSGGIHHCKKFWLLRVTQGYPEYFFLWNPPLVILSAFHLLSRVYPRLPWVIICDNFNGGFHHCTENCCSASNFRDSFFTEPF